MLIVDSKKFLYTISVQQVPVYHQSYCMCVGCREKIYTDVKNEIVFVGKVTFLRFS